MNKDKGPVGDHKSRPILSGNVKIGQLTIRITRIENPNKKNTCMNTRRKINGGYYPTAWISQTKREREEFKQAKIDDYFRLVRPQINIQTKDIIKCIHVNINGLNAKKYKIIQFL